MSEGLWPRQSQCRAFYGAPGQNHARLDLPFPMKLAWDKRTIIRSFTINTRCLESARRAFDAIAKAYTPEELAIIGLDIFGGCYNNRPMRGGTTLSMHAYACAIDFDPERNQLKWGRERARLAKRDCDAFWNAWEKEGWVSLGRARDFDWMHVQAARL